MKAVIFLNGEYNYKKESVQKLIDKKDIIFCADGGADYAYEYKIRPDYIIGDLDSISPLVLNFYKKEEVNIEKYNPEKDYTDFELILYRIEGYQKEKNIKFEKVYVLGGLGKRIDMTLNNLHLMEKYPYLVFLSENEEIFYMEKSFSLNNRKNCEFSIIPLDSSIQRLSLKGFRYELEGADIKRKSSRLVSNVIISDKCTVNFEKGKFIVVLRKNS